MRGEMSSWNLTEVQPFQASQATMTRLKLTFWDYFQKFWPQPYWKFVHYALKLSLCQENNQFKWTVPILPHILPELCQKTVVGYQEHLVEVHLVKVHLTNHKWGCMYAFEPIIFSEMMQFPQAQDAKFSLHLRMFSKLYVLTRIRISDSSHLECLS